MKKNLLFFGLLLIIGFQLVIAQGSEITGTVTESETNLPLIGVNIMIKGTTLGTVTDLDGNYTLSVPDQDAILVFSFVGYHQQEIPLNNLTTVNVSMVESAELLDEVMVVAYGTTKKASFTGAASSVDAEDIVRMPVTSFEKALAGNVAGVQIANSTGQPGSGTEIRIRGRGSFSASNEPLYVIDGIPVVSGEMHSSHGGVNPGNVMSTINPGDIENITVLKDAAASSLYGSRAANGVILITTKQGKAGVTKYAVKGYYGISDFAVTNYEGVTGDEFIMLHRESMENYWGVGDPRVDEEMIKQNYVKPEGGYTDWYDVLFRKGKVQNFDISATGGNEKTHFFISANIFDQEGLALNSAMLRYSGRLNITHKINKMFSVGANILTAYTDQDIADGGTRYFNPFYNVNRNCFPTEAVYDSNGEYRYELQNGYYNLAREYGLNERSAKVFRSMNTAWLEFRPFEFLTFRTTNRFDWLNNDETNYASPLSRSGEDEGGRISNTNRKNIRLSTTNLLTFDYTVSDLHHINAIAAFEAESERSIRYSAYGENLPNEGLQNIGVAAVPSDVYGYDDGSSIMSILSRVNYDFKNKYYFSASFRRDGSSKLGANERWANFYSLSGAWRLSSESFMSGINFLDDLKIRASFGTNGTLPPGRYEHMALYSYDEAYDGVGAATEAQISNDNLTWEKSINYNVGIDFSFFNRVSGSFELFKRFTDGLLMNMPLSRVTGFSSTWRNVGQMENQGFELALRGRIIDGRNFNWTASYFHTQVDNKITKLPDDEDIVSGRYIRRVGEPYYTFYLPIWAGVNPDDGSPQWYVVDENENITSEKSPFIGDVDRAIAGNAEPDFFGSFNNEFSYKGFRLTFMFTFSVGGQIWYRSGYKSWNDGYKVQYVIQRDQVDRWQKPGDIARHPQRIWKGNMDSEDYSSRFLLDNNYLRLKDLMLAYTLPQKWTQRIRINNVTVYTQASNYLTFAQQEIMDPEQRANGYPYFEMPPVKTLTFGLEIEF